ncbi:MAG: aldehyde dehydrogenase family protein [Chloroflexi bacterium]|nr:aldehyde dehydrogenase family protein [Chloroflexota bacterium]
MATFGRVRAASGSAELGLEKETPLLGEYGSLVGGKSLMTGDRMAVRSPYDHSLVAVVHRAGPAEIERAIAGATAAFQTTRKLPSWKRAEVLEKASAGIAAKREEFARTIALEAGKPIKTARAEVDRAIFTLKVAAEESKRIHGEIVSLDWLPGNEGREGHVRRVPLGPIVGISPFNFPLNLVVHKLAPALAAGNPIIIRPASQTPLSALKLGQVVLDAGWPEDGVAVVPSKTFDASPLIDDDRIRLLTFTGSPAVGWSLKARAGRKRVTLELGGNAGVIVHSDADIGYAAERVAWGGFSYAGQSCISVQRVYVHADVYDAFLKELLPRVGALRVGDPLEQSTDVGPLIDAGAAERVEQWVEESKQRHAQVLTGGTRDGNLWYPTVLGNVPADLRVVCQEVFAPLVAAFRYDDVHQAIKAIDTSDFGLQAGLFTHDERIIQEAFDEISVGGLMVNDVSTFRIDHMPYGGVKESGFGREGLRYAIEEMTEMKLLTLRRS